MENRQLINRQLITNRTPHAKYPLQFRKRVVQWYKDSKTASLVEDCFNFVRYLVAQGKLNPNEILEKNNFLEREFIAQDFDWDKNIGVFRLLILHFLMCYFSDFEKWKKEHKNN